MPELSLKDFIEQYPEQLTTLRTCGEAAPGRVLLDATTIARDDCRRQLESKPVISDDITKDFRFMAGAVWAFNQLLRFPEKAHEEVQRLERAN